tara:strand:+ start:1588 stop:1851 length:264 start_codon:yes stop_codon:yes gene_type:complete
MFDKLEKVCEELGYKIQVHEQGEDLWHVSVRGELSTVAHAHGKNQDDAAAKVLELLKPKPKAVPKKRSKPAKNVATKKSCESEDGDE